MSVLIVDDDPMIAAMLEQVIRHLDKGFVCESVWAEKGAAARRELKKRRFQLVLLDYMLPDEDGLAVLAAINALPVSERPVVIMLTGEGNEQVAVQAMKMGATDYIAKPVLNFPALRRSIVTALEHHLLEEKLARSTEELRRKNLEMDADLALARGVQLALLPQSYPVFPAGVPLDRSALQFCHRWIPSEKVAGDLFDVFPVGENAVGIFLFDVMGHGVRAALVTALLRGLVREQLQLADRPGMFLAAINRGLQTLLGQTGDLVFVTAAYVVVDATSGKVNLASAGHPAPLLLRRRAGVVASLAQPEGPGPALGLLPETIYDGLETLLGPGDAVLLFTDGLFEAANVSGEQFGRSRLLAAVEARLAQPTPLLIDAVLADILTFQAAGTIGFEDDVCLVAVDRAEPNRLV
jgi:serine phosphatase RsbU (regulator of sigma subunit)